MMMKQYAVGGLKVLDLVTKVQTQREMWIKRFLWGNSHPSKEYPRFLIDKNGGNHLVFSDLELRKAPSMSINQTFQNFIWIY